MLTKTDKAGIAFAVCAWFGLMWYAGTHPGQTIGEIAVRQCAPFAVKSVGSRLDYQCDTARASGQ